jgi:hypothetical protein
MEKTPRPTSWGWLRPLSAGWSAASAMRVATMSSMWMVPSNVASFIDDDGAVFAGVGSELLEGGVERCELGDVEGRCRGGAGDRRVRWAASCG